MEFIDLRAQQRRIRKDIEIRIAAVLDHGKYILGPEVEELEKRLSRYTGSRNCITVSSGTDALLIALMALGIGPGDEVITVPYTWISTAEVIALAGAKPVFVDIEEDTWNMNPNLVADAITENTKAIMPVGIYGQTANMTAINQVAAQNGELPVIEDACQSFGATHHQIQSGALSLIGCTSFYPSKPLGCYGDGGAIFTDDDALAEKMKWIRVHGQEKPHHHPVLGVNGRFDTIQAAVLLAKMEIFPEEAILRQEVARRYSAAISNMARYTTPHIEEYNTSVFAQYTILCEDRNAVQVQLSQKNIPSVPYYAVPVHLQPVFDDLNYDMNSCPISKKIADHGLSLPMGPYLSHEEQDRVIAALS